MEAVMTDDLARFMRVTTFHRALEHVLPYVTARELVGYILCKALDHATGEGEWLDLANRLGSLHHSM